MEMLCSRYLLLYIILTLVIIEFILGTINAPDVVQFCRLFMNTNLLFAGYYTISHI